MERIESVKNIKIKTVKKLHTRKGREKLGSFLIEGEHLVEEALNSNVIINEIFIEENFTIPSNWDLSNIPIYIVNDKIMKEICDTQTPQGIVAVCELLGRKPLTIEKNGLYILIDQVQDPGNLGTIIRTADCAGLSGVILGTGTVDMYNSKVIRSTQGSIFHLPIVRGELTEWVEKFKSEKIPVYGTALNEKAKEYRTVMAPESFALIVGNEGNGLSKELLQVTDENLFIPIYGEAESLNVSIATGILLYHLRK
ncbi:RNA methyltransferase [Anaerobacillus alkalidiazotrophicus]|uniref:RNA methyltransferase n=1 Tax=Anaerobacillus alkalidiazotrophicus TaxID=472963 RepID=A0A1S2M595_9BACI|nr:RNA methyltransferase [Anaerobacillus alkalidiazotrophicus]OIJ18307.1 RNA methyltransferase [Anaerobacillus alkalidiazotrophicus]OIJ19786.1 RNA methyltransferase [Anaerobacillus alkalidiazotrophicus]